MLENLLNRFASAKQAIAEHIEQNKSVFDAHQKLLFNLMDIENELRDQIALKEEEVVKNGLSNGLYTVKVLPMEQTIYDDEKLQKYLTPEQYSEVVKIQKRPSRVSIVETPGARN